MTRTRRLRTTPQVRALVEQIDAELRAAHERARVAFSAILASHGITGPARIMETAGTVRRPVLVIELPAKEPKPPKRSTPPHQEHPQESPA